MDVLALAQGALDSGARCTFFSAPCCAPRGERPPFVGREGRGRGARRFSLNHVHSRTSRGTRQVNTSVSATLPLVSAHSIMAIEGSARLNMLHLTTLMRGSMCRKV